MTSSGVWMGLTVEVRCLLNSSTNTEKMASLVEDAERLSTLDYTSRLHAPLHEQVRHAH